MAGKTILISDIHELMTMESALKVGARGPMDPTHLSLQKNVSMIVKDGLVAWVGKKSKIPREWRQKKMREISADANVFPGFIDCHTHSVFAGDRKNEFELRNAGVSYQEIASRGGGIQATVKATRQASVKVLAESLSLRLDRFLEQGVTTVEVKTGYGLNLKEEVRLLKVIRQTPHKVNVVPTFLGAHGSSPETPNNNQYLALLKEGLERIVKDQLAERVDIFVEQGYFTVDQARDYLSFAKKLGLGATVHADQLSRTGATQMCVDLGAQSADHAICVSDGDIKKISQSPLTCVLLPAADFYIHCPYPPARKMIDQGVRVALATDFNPGSSPTQCISLVGVLARLKMSMNLPEVFVAYTLGSAFALGRAHQMGALVPGYQADFFISESSWQDFFYDLSQPDIHSVWIKGEKVIEN